jgi:hypothetical protein
MHQRTSTDGEDSMGISIDVGDGLVTREDPVAPLSDTLNVKLNSEPSGDVVLGPIQSLTPDEVDVSPSSLTFTSSNWNTPQAITVTGVDDGIADNVQIAVIDLGVLSGGGFDNVDPGDITVQNLDDETAGSPAVILMNDGLVTDESGAVNDFFLIVLNEPPAANVTIGTIASTDTGEVTVSPSNLTFTTSNWTTPQNVNLGGVDDFLYDGMQMVTVSLGNTTSSDPDWDGIALGSVTAYNLDNDAPKGITVLAGSSNFVGEGNVSQFEVVLDAQPSANVTIGVSSSNPSEAAVAPASLTFTSANWNNPQSVTVTGVDDPVADGNQACAMNFSAAMSSDGEYNGINPTPSSIPFTVLDNDSTGITITAVSTLSVSESGSSQSFDVVLNSEPLASVDIAVTSSDTGEGIITAPALGTLTFTTANWNVAQTVTVQGVDDAGVDGNQPFEVVLGAASSSDGNYNGINPNDVPCVTIDDESNKSIMVLAGSSTLVSESGSFSQFELVLTSAPTTDVTINTISSSDTSEGTVSPGSLTFTNLNWSTPQTVQVFGQDDDEQDGNRLFSVSFAAATSSDPEYNGQTPTPLIFENIDDDTAGITIRAGSSMLVSESGTTSSFEVVLNSRPVATVSIDVWLDVASEGEITTPFVGDTGTLTFDTGNWQNPQTVNVMGENDFVADGNQAFTLFIDPAVSGGDANYDGMPLSIPNVAFLNVDDDSYGVAVDMGDGLLTTETGGADFFNIVLNSEPTDVVTINLTSTAPGEVIISPSSVNFNISNWNILVPITVTGVDDALVDGLQPVVIDLGTVSSADGNYNGMAPDDVTVYNIDDESIPEVLVLDQPGGFITTENGASVDIRIILNQPPSADVTFSTIQSMIPSEGVVATPGVTFTPVDWNTPHTVRVTGVDDAIADPDMFYDIDLGFATSADPSWDGLPGGLITILNLDHRVITDYLWTPPNGAPYTTISVSGTVVNFRHVDFYDGYDPEDEGYEYVTIGFSFFYMGMPYDQITVYSNGFASFNPYPYSANAFANEFLIQSNADADIFQNILAPWWDDLHMGLAGGNVFYETTGFAPNRVHTIEWENAIYTVASDDTYNFQIKLYEFSNIIEFAYGSKSGDVVNDTTASVGIKDDVGGDLHIIDGLNGATDASGGPPNADDTWGFTDFPTDSVIKFEP